MAPKKKVKRKPRPKTQPLIPLGGNAPSKTAEELAAEQGVKPVTDIEEFLASGRGIWRDDEEIDEFIDWLHRARRTGRYD